MKRMLAIFFGITMILATVGAATAAAERPEDAGPGDNNQKGLCTAYFNGQKKGHNKDGKDSPPPFADLEDRASEYDEENFDEENDANNTESEDRQDERQISDDVFEYCNNNFEIMGQPEKNGRFDCREGEDRNGAPHDQDEDGEIECDPMEE